MDFLAAAAMRQPREEPSPEALRDGDVVLATCHQRWVD
jgi:hypothetical protein